MTQCSEILGANGPFNDVMDNFAVRQCQQQMADAVEKAIVDRDILIAESGTGTGKTFSYLVPALMNRKKVIVSTFTNHLQDQIFHNDIPLVCRALNVDPEVRLLKGRSHYLCRYRYEQNIRNPELGFKGSRNAALDTVARRLDDNPLGELSELLHGLRNRTALATELSSTADNCLRSKCDWWNDCCVNSARRKARDADVLVINHNLLSLNLLNAEDSDSSMLPQADVIIVDEAHRLPDVVAASLGRQVSTARFAALCDDFEKMAGEFQLNPEGFGTVIRNVSSLSASLHTHIDDESRTGSLSDLEANEQFMEHYTALVQETRKLSDHLASISDEYSQFEPYQDAATRLAEEAFSLFDSLEAQTADWYQRSSTGVEMKRVPLDPADDFKQMVDNSEAAWILTSATLAVGQDFAHYSKRTGIDQHHGRHWNSPFHYLEQSLLYLPSDMPRPGSAEYNRSVAEVVKSVVRISRGRTFILFTSYKALREVQELISNELDYKILSQTDSISRYELLRRFKQDGNAVLLGTMSFWEGVDVKGEALSCVIIDKLPFASPDNPVLKARINHINSMGENAFFDWQIPEAALILKQGAGRLIRDINDRGVLVVCDPRVLTKGYGKLFLDSLPPMPRSSELKDIEVFFNNE